jgi:hypothetical protein
MRLSQASRVTAGSIRSESRRCGTRSTKRSFVDGPRATRSAGAGTAEWVSRSARTGRSAPPRRCVPRRSARSRPPLRRPTGVSLSVRPSRLARNPAACCKT